MIEYESTLSKLAGQPTSIRRRALNRVLLGLPLAARRRAQYLLAFDRPLHLRQPQSWTEKINWRMVYDRRDLIAMTCDKLATKEWVDQMTTPGTVEIPRTAWSGADLTELAEAEWPERWVLKPNHGTGSVQLGSGRPEPAQMAELTGLAHRWLTDAGPEIWGEWGYNSARRLVILEERVPGTPDTGRNDYKFYVIGGTVRLVQVDTDRFSGHVREYYTPEGQIIVDGDSRRAAPAPHPPAGWDAMVEVASKLGAVFDAIRVDLYLENEVPWFGELTAYDGSGLSRFPSAAIDRSLGAFWQLPADVGAAAS